MGRMTDAMQMVAIMTEFGWTFEEYQNSPVYVIALIKEKMTRDRKEQEIAAKRNQHRGY